MAKQNRTILKTYFQQGDIPTQGQYADLIDSQLNLNDGNTQILSGSISASNFISSTGISLAGTISSSGNLEIGNITSSAGVSITGKLTAASAVITDITGSNISASLQLITDKIQQGSAADGINIIGSITASANISASGTITGTTLTTNTLNVNNSITSSGAVSASGALIGKTLRLGGANVNSTAAELNILDGVTATTAEINFLDGVSSNIKEAYDGVENVAQGILRFTELDNGTDTINLTGFRSSERPTFSGVSITKTSLTSVNAMGDEFTDEGGSGGFEVVYGALEPGLAVLAAVINFPESAFTSVFSGTTNSDGIMVFGVNKDEDKIKVFIVNLTASGISGGGIQVRYTIS